MIYKVFYTIVPFTTSLCKHLCSSVGRSRGVKVCLGGRIQSVPSIGRVVMECAVTSYTPPHSSGFVCRKMYLFEVRDVEGLCSLPAGPLKAFRSENGAGSDLFQLSLVMDAGFVVTAESGLRSIPHIRDPDTEMNLPHHRPTLGSVWFKTPLFIFLTYIYNLVKVSNWPRMKFTVFLSLQR